MPSESEDEGLPNRFYLAPTVDIDPSEPAIGRERAVEPES